MVHECGHFLAAKRVGVRVEEFSLGVGPVLWKRKNKDTQYQISAIPLGGYVKLAGDNLQDYQGKPDEYFAQPPGKRFQIIFLGPLFNYILGFLLFWFIFFVGYPSLTTKVGGLLEGFGAAQAGIQEGDRILAIEGTTVKYWDELQNAIRQIKDVSSVRITVEREGREFQADVPLIKKDFEDSFGKKQSLGILGVTPFDEVVTVRHGFFASCILGSRKTIDITKMTYLGIWRIISGQLSLRDSVTGPLGIFFITSKVARMGLIAVLHLFAVLSVSLGLFNLLPLPVLDGGHIFLLAVEKIRGKGLGAKTERVVNKVGFSFIITLAVLATYNDIMRIFGDKISKFFFR